MRDIPTVAAYRDKTIVFPNLHDQADYAHDVVVQ